MSSTYLYSDNDTTYDMSVSSTGTVLSYTDITTRVPLPSIQANANKYLKVRNDGQNLEWAEVEIGGGLELILDERTTSNPPSVCFEDTSGTKYNTGINMYRDTTNANSQTLSLYANDVKKLDVAENRMVVGTVANPVPLIVNGSINSATTSVSTSASWNNLALDAYVLNTASASFTLTLNGTGTATIGRTIRFYKSNTANNIIFTSTDGVAVRLTGPFGTQQQTNANYTHVPTSSGQTWLFEITRTEATNYQLTNLSQTDGTNTYINGNIFRAGDGIVGTPSFSFSNTNGTDTGMFYVFDTIDRLRFSAGGTNTLEMNNNQSFFNNRLLANATGNNTTPALIFHNDSSSTGYSGQRTNPLTDPRLWAVVNGVQSTELTTTQFNIGLNTSNNTNMKTLNQNGATNFNTFTPSYSSFLVPQTAIGTIGQSLSGVDFDGTNYVVSVVGTGVGNKLFVSSNLSTWTTISDTNSTINLGNSQVQYGNGIWCYLSRTSNTRQLWTTTTPADPASWTQTANVSPWSGNRQTNRLRFINGQFIVLNNNSTIRYSSNGLTWTEYTANGTAYAMNDIAYSPELQRYVIVCGVDVLLHFSGNTINSSSTFTAITTGVERANGITYSSKLGMFLYHTNINPFQNYFYSRDGINWTSYTNPTSVTASNNTIWINDFGGFFLDMQFNNNNLAISRDGLSFQTIPNNLSLNSVNCVYNSTNKVLLIVGSSGSWGTYRNLLTDFNNYLDSDNIYNTFNSNVRFADTIEYQSQNITTATGNTHFPVSFFNRSVINFDTSSSNANIYLQGTSYNGRVGMKFKFVKTASTANNVRLHGFETCRLLTPLGNVPSFNAQSSPQTYSILPAGVFGSFDLTRVSDSGNGIWLVDNVMAMDANGTEVAISNLQSAGDLFALGRVLTLRLTDGLLEGNTAIETHTTTIDTPYNLTINRNGSNGTHIKLVDFTDIGADKVGFVFYMGQQANTNLTIWQIKNSSGRDLWLHEAAYDAVANTGVRTLATSTVNNFNTYYCSFITVGGDRRWIVRRFVN